MPILAASHDLAHPVEPDTAWSESYYFNAYDPESDSGFFTRIGIRPNEGTMDVGLSVWLPGGELAEYRHMVDQHEMVGSPLVVGGVRYELLEAMESWRILADVDAEARTCHPSKGTDAPRPPGRGRPVRRRLARRWAPTGSRRAARGAIRPRRPRAPPERATSNRPVGGRARSPSTASPTGGARPWQS